MLCVVIVMFSSVLWTFDGFNDRFCMRACFVFCRFSSSEHLQNIKMCAACSNLYIRTHQMCFSLENMKGVLQAFKIYYIKHVLHVFWTSNVFCMCSSLEHMKRSGRVQFMRRMCSVYCFSNWIDFNPIPLGKCGC